MARPRAGFFFGDAALLWDSPQRGLQVAAIVSALAWVWGFWTNWLHPARIS